MKNEPEDASEAVRAGAVGADERERTSASLALTPGAAPATTADPRAVVRRPRDPRSRLPVPNGDRNAGEMGEARPGG